ncbi:DoxX [Pseudovibrio axinellae]|uniref:DoxX n=1 Tax=Pseudovibrio axinellae TaxID=989403 RepID=A0A166ASZ8_9HYPH|nr:DoxX family membrane protein [Pseudovibrio axinellae]KZL21511.1 DoxX [Pseudovibrio axinellae]SER07708.1 putative oxidoreductase [Pseudovibrio axinellae]
MADKSNANPEGMAEQDDLAETARPFHYLSFFQLLQSLITALLLGVAALISLEVLLSPIPESALHSLLIWLALAFFFVVIVVPKNFTLGFLCFLLCQLIAWRITSLYGAYLLSWPLAFAFLVNLIWFLSTIQRNSFETAGRGITLWQWQLTFFRMLIGFVMVPHFTDKLFAGALPYMEHVEFLSLLGYPDPNMILDISGVAEFAIAIGVGLGFLTRLSCFFAAAFILFAASLSGSLEHGFVSFATATSWELPLILFASYLSFTTTGGGEFSVDGALRRTGKVPGWIKLLMGDTSLAQNEN